MSGGLAGAKMLNLGSRECELESLEGGKNAARVNNGQLARGSSTVSVQNGCWRQPTQAAWRLLYAALQDSCSRAIRSLPSVWRLRPNTPNAK